MRQAFSGTGSRAGAVGYLTVFTALLFGVWWMWRGETPSTPESRLGLVVDVSGSMQRGSLCPEVAQFVRAHLDGFQGRVLLHLFETGDGSTGGLPTAPLQADERVAMQLEARVGDGPIERIAADVEAACQALPDRQQSPVFAAVDAALRELPAEACGRAGTSCVLVVASDLQETEDEEIRGALKSGDAPAPRLSNEHVRVAFCGLIHHQGDARAGGLSIERTERVWRALFSGGDAPTFRPLCVGLRSLAEGGV